MSDKILYCIMHEAWITLPWDISKFCIVTTSEPPELPDGWELMMEPPTPDEMVLIDQNATELALDLELA